jgi:geranyl-CoA carboxylase alpha subunit
MGKNNASLRVDGTTVSVTTMSPAKGQLHCSIQGRDAFFKDMIILDGMGDEDVGGGRVIAPMHGLLLEVLVKPGDLVVKGQTLVVLEAMKMHYEIQADIAGKVAEVSAVAGKQVSVDDVLIEIDEQQDAAD